MLNEQEPALIILDLLPLTWGKGWPWGSLATLRQGQGQGCRGEGVLELVQEYKEHSDYPLYLRRKRCFSSLLLLCCHSNRNHVCLCLNSCHDPCVYNYLCGHYNNYAEIHLPTCLHTTMIYHLFNHCVCACTWSYEGFDINEVTCGVPLPKRSVSIASPFIMRTYPKTYHYN